MLKIITSKDNKIFKLCEKLTHKKYRDKLGKYIIEGPLFVEEAISTVQNIDRVVLDGRILKGEHGSEDASVFERRRKSETAYEQKCDCGTKNGYEAANVLCDCSNENSALIRLINRLIEAGLRDKFIFMKGHLFDKVAQTKTSQGVFAIINKHEFDESDLDEIAGELKNLIILDRLQDPGNLGTIIRTADAAGFSGIVAVKGTGDVYAPKVARAAAGSLFRVPVIYVDTAKRAAELLKKRGKKIIAALLDADRNYYDTHMAHDAVIVIGNESTGISEELMDISDEKIRIPMSGDVDSINAAIAAGILMYTSVAQQRRM